MDLAVRAFVAIDLATALTSRIIGVQKELQDAATQSNVRVSWVPPTKLHLTLKFLGEIPEASVPAIRQSLSKTLARRGPLPISLGSTGAFPSSSDPRVIWVGVRNERDELAELARDIDRSLTDLGFAAETRSFHGHVTLGRVKADVAGAALASSIDKARTQLEGSATINEVVLYRSDLNTKSAAYTALARIGLGNGSSHSRM